MKYKRSDIKVGSFVKVTRKAKHYESNWNNSWQPAMDSSVGSVFEVKQGDTGSGIFLSNGWWYPSFAVKQVKAPQKPLTIKLNEAYSGTINLRGVTVGCQTFSFKTIDKLHKLCSSFRKKNAKAIESLEKE